MTMPNLNGSKPCLMRYSALSYANQWYMTDRKFMSELKKKDSQEICDSILWDLAKKYMVARGFKINKSDPHSRQQIWLKAAACLATAAQRAEIIEAKVETLAVELGEVAPVKSTPSKLLSAATKFLWFAGEYEVRILDKRAVDALSRLSGVRGKLGSRYELYASVWENQYEAHTKVLLEALVDLPQQLAWTCIPSSMHAEAKAVFKDSWFADRVFDKYLWTLGIGEGGGATTFA